MLRVREPGHRMLRTIDLGVHVHLWSEGASHIERHLAFRDRLRVSGEDRDRYAATKRQLAARDWPTMDHYADAKTDVIQQILDPAAPHHAPAPTGPSRSPILLRASAVAWCDDHDVAQVELRPLVGEMHDVAALQRVLEAAPDYAHRVTGHPPGPAEAQSLFTALPPGVDDDRKTVYGVVVAGEMVGCVDLIRGWPTEVDAHIGLLLLDEEHVGRGLGRAAYEAVEAVVRRWPEIRRVRAAVVATNAAVLPFWRRMGLSETGEVKPYQYDKLTSRSIILAKELEDPRAPSFR